jgi:V/A-type H+-transporting ATPase subunit E
MPTDIETFVKTLESEGVDAGRKAAQKIEADAKEQAEKILAEGKAKAEQIIKDANSEAEKIKARMNSSLELATRDAIYMLREKLTEQLKNLLQLNVGKALNDEDTLANVLREVIPAYTKADAAGKQNTEVNISGELKSRLLEGTLRELKHSLKEKSAELDVKYNLAKAGFEFKVEGSTVEVSTESVTALLSEMIDPELQQFLEKAAEKKN